ncbi:hypothetical protein QP918_09035 [Corynebacterium accolens]|nr:hypothetical protein [Corynebacterium accolens]MDK8469576.1 hypothetical protein [Corynebacterium accolens]MDK8675595.1 hypothetical protein [Corynebacterium accolens]
MFVVFGVLLTPADIVQGLGKECVWMDSYGIADDDVFVKVWA